MERSGIDSSEDMRSSGDGGVAMTHPACSMLHAREASHFETNRTAEGKDLTNQQ